MNKSFIGKKLLSLMLSVLMCLSLIPTVAFATIAEGETATVAKIGEAEYKTLAEAIAAANNGDTITLGTGNFSTYGKVSTNKSLTFVGQDKDTVWTIGDLTKDVKAEGNGDYTFDGADTITFKKMTLKSDGADYRGFIRINHTVVDGCFLEGKTAFWGYGKAEFLNSTFNAPEGDYALWDYSSKEMSFDGCKFNISGKGVNVYVEAGNAGEATRKVSMNDCTVNSTKPNKAFLNIKNKSQAYDVVISGDNKVTRLAADQTTGSNLYQVEKSDISDSGKPVKVQKKEIVDGKEVLTTIYEVKVPSADPVVAIIGEAEYKTLAEAIAAAKDGDTVTLLANCSGNGIVVAENKYPTGITIDFAGYSYTVGGKLVGSTGTASNGFQLLAGNTITMKNGFIYGDASVAGDDKTVWRGAPAIMIQNYSNLTLDNMTVSGGKQTVYTISNNNGNTVIKDSIINAGNAEGTKYSPVAFDVCRYSSYPSVSVTVEGNSVINGNIEISGGIGNGQSRQLNIKNGTFNGKFSVESNVPANIAISGGKFAYEINPDYCADGFIPASNADGTYGVKAGSYVAQIGNKKYETLADAIRLAAKGKTITLLADIEVNSTLSIAENLIIDLNGKTLTGKTGSYMFNIAEAASVTFENGTINVADNYGAMNVYGQLSLQNVNIEGAAIKSSLLLINGNANVTVDKATTISANADVKDCYPAILFEDSEEYHNPILKVYGTIKAIMMPAIQGNGADKGTTDIYIYDGAKVLSNKLAMYLPQLCNVNITGGLVEGYCGIGIKSGTLNISGGEVRGIANDYVIGDEYSQTNGISYDGSAILIDSYVGYAGQVKINISGNAVVSSKYSTAIREIGNDASQTNVVAIGISGGQILGAEGKQAVLVREASVSMVSISGGTFSSAVPADYCAAGYAPKANTDGTYGVEPKAATGTRKLSVEINGYGTVDYSIIGGVSGTWDNSITNVPYEIGTQFTLKAIPGDGFTFLYWVNSEGRVLTDNLTYNFYLGDNLTIKAVFCKTENSNAYVIFRDRGNTILKATPADSEGYIDVPTNLIAYAGYTFIGWYDVDGKEYIVTDGKIQVSGNAAITIYAKYKADTETVYTVTVDNVEKGKYTYGSYVTVTAEDIEGKVFAGWYINGTLVSYDKAYSFYVTGNVALEARYSDTVVVKEPVITLLVSERKETGNGSQYIIFTAAWSADSSYTFVEAGIILAKDNSKELTLENVDNSTILKTVTRLTTIEGTYAHTLTLSSAAAKANAVYARAYFTFIKDGKVVTIYTTVQISEPI